MVHLIITERSTRLETLRQPASLKITSLYPNIEIEASTPEVIARIQFDVFTLNRILAEYDLDLRPKERPRTQAVESGRD